MAPEREWRFGDPQQQRKWADTTTDALRVHEGKWKIVTSANYSELRRRLGFPNSNGGAKA
jgi:hypothetical protein